MSISSLSLPHTGKSRFSQALSRSLQLAREVTGCLNDGLSAQQEYRRLVAHGVPVQKAAQRALKAYS